MRKPLIIAVTALSALSGGDMANAARPASALGAGGPFVAMDEIAAPIIGDSRIEGTLSVMLVIETPSLATAGALKKRIPALRATALTATLEFSRLHASGFLPVNAERLSADLNAALKRAHPDIARVLIVRLGATPD